MPFFLVLPALNAMAGSAEGLTDPAPPIVAGVSLLLATPTTWLFALLDLSPVLTVVLGIVTSFPLWFLLGSRLAETSIDWGEWGRRYIGWSVAWAVTVVVGFTVVATIVA